MPYNALLAAENPYTYLNPGGIAFNLTVLLIGLLLGGLLATIATVFYNMALRRFFAALRRENAISPDTAKTLAELGVRGVGLGRALLSRSSLVRKLVSVRLPDGTVLAPIHSLDDDKAAEEAAKSAIHAEDEPEPLGSAYVRPGESAASDGAPTEGEESTPTESEESAASVRFDPHAAAYFLDTVHRRRAELRFEKRGNDVRFLIPAIIAFVALFATLPVYLPYFAKMLDGLLTSLFGG